jgi:hypothetical protein
MRKCYIAGPMRGIPQANYPAFFFAEAQLQSRGWEVFNPARLDALDTHDPVPVDLPAEELAAWITPERCRRFARRDLGVLLNELKAENGDAVIMLPGWENSKGACAERATAWWLGLEVLPLAMALQTVVGDRG